MEEKNNPISGDAGTNRNDLEPGRGDRNLLSDTRSEAPLDKDQSMAQSAATEAGDETYEDEELNDPDYFEKRAGDDVRK